jgi:acyl carrier protein
MLQGVTSSSVQWGAWAGAGMAGNDASTRLRVERTGLGMVEIPAGLAALEGLLLRVKSTLPAVAGAVPINWPRFMQIQFKDGVPPMFAAFQTAPTAAATAGDHGGQLKGKKTMMGRRRGAPPASAVGAATARSSVQPESQMYLAAQVQEAVKATLGGEVDPEQPLMAAGLDSLSSVEFRNALEGRLGMDLPSTLVFDYPTVTAMSAFLATKVQTVPDLQAEEALGDEEYEDGSGSEWGGELYSPTASTRVGGYAAHALQGAVLLSGMVIRSPQDALEALHPSDAVGLVPISRWDPDAHQSRCIALYCIAISMNHSTLMLRWRLPSAG